MVVKHTSRRLCSTRACAKNISRFFFPYPVCNIAVLFFYFYAIVFFFKKKVGIISCQILLFLLYPWTILVAGGVVLLLFYIPSPIGYCVAAGVWMDRGRDQMESGFDNRMPHTPKQSVRLGRKGCGGSTGWAKGQVAATLAAGAA